MMDIYMATEEAYKRGLEDGKPKWISVKDRLPEKGVWVLCVGAKGGLFLADRMSAFSDGSCYCHVPNSRGGRYATHWMPIPEPPKEGSKA